MRRGTYRVKNVIVNGHGSPLTDLSEVVAAMAGDHKVINIKLKNGRTGSFSAKAHKNGQSVAMTEPHEGTRATLFEGRLGLRLKVG